VSIDHQYIIWSRKVKGQTMTIGPNASTVRSHFHLRGELEDMRRFVKSNLCARNAI
jgi:hypothetical protein